jgi:hypothetical protein
MLAHDNTWYLLFKASSAEALEKKKLFAKSTNLFDSLNNRIYLFRCSSCSSMHGAAAAAFGGASNVRECPLCLSECTLDQVSVL